MPVAEYTLDDVKREFVTAKSCAPHCTIGCVHRISHIDHWRAPQTRMVAPGGQELVKIRVESSQEVETGTAGSVEQKLDGFLLAQLAIAGQIGY